MFAITRPLSGRMNGVSSLEQTFNRLFNEALTGMDWQARDSAAASWVPPVDVFEAVDEIRILAEVPGVKPEDVKISVEGNVLTVQGTKQQVAEEKTDRVHRYERTYGTFERTFTLPGTVDETKIKAHYENGVLVLSLPKAEKAKPRQIPVQVTKG